MKKEILALGSVILIIAAFAHETWLGGYSPFRGDIPAQFYAWKSFTRASLEIGEIPYWNPYTHGGAPFLANMQSAVFYPLDLLLMLFPMGRFFGLSLLLHLLLGGVGAYLLARKCGASEFPSMIAGVAYGLNGFTMIHIPAGNHLTYAGAAWAPWLLWATTGFVQTQTQKLRWGMIGAVIAFMQFLCGHPQMAFYSFFFSMLMCVTYNLWLWWKIHGWSVWFPLCRSAFWAFCIALGVFLAGFQLMPTLEYMEHANRAESLDVDMATEFSFAPHKLITLVFPEYFGTKLGATHTHYDPVYPDQPHIYWSCAYAGIMIPVLAAVGLFMLPRSNALLPLMVVGFVGLFLAWGRGNPFYALWMELPGFGHFRAPAKYLPYYLTALTTLAALGVDKLCGWAYARQKNHDSKSELINRSIQFTVLMAVIFGYGAPRIFSVFDYARALPPSEIGNIRLSAVIIGFCLAASSAAAFLFARRIPKYPRMAVSFALTLILALDLFTFGRGYLLDSNLMLSRDILLASAAPQEIGYVKTQYEEPAPDRIATLSDIWDPNSAMLWKIPNAAGYDPLSLKSYNRMIGKMEGWNEGEFHDNILLTQWDHQALDDLDVRYILTRRQINAAGIKEVFRGGYSIVYERTSPKRAWAMVAPQTGQPFTPEQLVPAGEAVKIDSYTPQRIAFTVNNNEPVWLRVSEWDYPGWQTELTGSGGETIPAEHHASESGLRLLSIPQGDWKVTMTYHPPLSGWLLTAFAALVFLLLAASDWMIRSLYIYKLAQKILGRYY